MSSSLPRLLLTLGDVAGIGPEIVARAWLDLLPLCRPAIVGDPLWVRRGLELIGSPARVHVVAHPTEAQPHHSKFHRRFLAPAPGPHQ